MQVDDDLSHAVPETPLGEVAHVEGCTLHRSVALAEQERSRFGRLWGPQLDWLTAASNAFVTGHTGHVVSGAGDATGEKHGPLPTLPQIRQALAVILRETF